MRLVSVGSVHIYAVLVLLYHLPPKTRTYVTDSGPIWTLADARVTASFGYINTSLAAGGELAPASHGKSWQVMVIHGESWEVMASHGDTWRVMGSHVKSWRVTARHGESRQVMASRGQSW